MFELGASKKSSGAFAAVVGQAELKEALLATVTNDELDGLLIQGEKGTAKSTAVRGLAEILPQQRVIADCPYGCPPDQPQKQCEECADRTDPAVETRPVALVTLPLGATRERVVGTLSVADALDGEHEFEPGVLARANRGILYVDEVNVLDDHLVDVLLDAAAGGVNRVERDGVSVTHPADFTLIGTMNPEEGGLRPQLRDRFALQATVTGCEAIDDRVAIIEQALGEGDDLDKGESDEEIRDRIVAARERLAGVSLADEFAAEIAELCLSAGVDGHRGDIAIARCARTFAALDGRQTVIESDLERAAELALPHRLESRPFEDGPAADDVLDEWLDDSEAEEGSDGEQDGGDAEQGENVENAESAGETDESSATEDSGQKTNGSGGDGGESAEERQSADQPQPPAEATPDEASHEAGESRATDTQSDRNGTHTADEPGDGNDQSAQSEATPLVPGQPRAPEPTESQTAEIGEIRAPDLEETSESESPERGRKSANSDGTRPGQPSVDGTGSRIRTERTDGTTGIDASASVRAAAENGRKAVSERDLRQSVRASTAGALVVFVVDASASMRPAMRTAKGTVLELLKDAYQQRDEVAFVTFAGESADVLLPPTDSVTLAGRHLKNLPTGDRTPLPDGLETATAVLDRADPPTSLVVIVTDGKSNVSENPVENTRQAARRLATHDPRVLVVDAGTDDRAGVVDVLLEATEGERLSLDALSAERVDTAVGRSQK